ncbi:MAG TPA: Rieske 2Fe-2S domain-containing protein [Chloroflexota bacterium]|nr:Rieske 2Fe-2S domain-containing protein [Chloroflexota bacterium]
MTQATLDSDGRDADWRDWAHTGPGTLAGRYLRRFWQPVYRSRDLARGKAVPIQIMSEDLTLYRGQSGEAHVVAFRCAHRGTQLSTGWVEGDNIRCRYHGWMYDATGQCVHQPAEVTPFCDRVRIRSYPTREYLGLIFVYLGEGEPPPMRRFPEMEGVGEREVTLHYRACNFFTDAENAVDQLHHYFVHWQRRGPVGEQVIPRLRVEETEYGIRITLNRPGEERTWSWHYHMPNILQLNISDFDQRVHWKVPVDDEHHLIPATALIAPGAVRRPSETHRDEDPIEFARRVSSLSEAIRTGRMAVDDIEMGEMYFPVGDDVTQVGQGAIADREHERLGSSDVGLVLLRTLWSRDLRAIAEGRSPKDWRHPEELLVATPRLYERV